MFPTELAARLIAPLQRELAAGCTDRLVQGGLEALVKNLAGPFPEVQQLLAGYGQMEITQRTARLEQALSLLRPPEAAPLPAPAADLDSALAPLGFSAAELRKLGGLGIKSLHDLLFFFPRRYEDRRTLRSARGLAEGDKATLAAVVNSRELVRTPKKGMQLVQAKLTDPSGTALRGIWFNQPWVYKQLREGQRIIATGRVSRRGGLALLVEYFEEDEGSSLSTGRIVPVYPLKEGVSQSFVRRMVFQGLEKAGTLPDPLAGYRSEFALQEWREALTAIHFPASETDLEAALNRLRFEEYFFLELRVLLQGGSAFPAGQALAIAPEWLAELKAQLPFQLTKAQEQAIAEIGADLAQPRQMARLLQGDVGSGKTVVAAAAIYWAVKNHLQAALMAPTEILARQHAQNLERYLAPLGVRIALLVGSLKESESRQIKTGLTAGEIDLVIGTQALIQDGVKFARLGLAVVDEEHRFGVDQRQALLQGQPHVLVMTATPIPRSLALTLYGDLETTVLAERPPGRTPIQTRLLTQRFRAQAYAFAQTQLEQGYQVLVVAPLIETSEATAELKAASDLANELQGLFPAVSVAILHGRMSGSDKEAVMAAMRAGQHQLLVSTTVIEVGVDLPMATLMIVENAERFGLAQLHQLRGRVGRGELPGYCILLAGEASKKTLERLRVIEQSDDGFAIAEADLKLRGPGELLGTRQWGLPEIKLGNLSQDVELIERARALAQRILSQDPNLSQPAQAELRQELNLRQAALGLRQLI